MSRDDNGFGGSWSRPSQDALDREEASWRAYDDKNCVDSVEALNAEIETLRAEVERLKAWGWRMASDEELKGFSDLHTEHLMITTASLNGMADEIQQFRTENERLIHSLKSELMQLRAEVERLKAPQKVLQASEVTEPGWYWWRLEPGYRWQIKNIWRRYIPSTNQWVLILSGEFIGPIPYPDPDYADS